MTNRAAGTEQQEKLSDWLVEGSAQGDVLHKRLGSTYKKENRSSKNVRASLFPPLPFNAPPPCHRHVHSHSDTVIHS